jgi:hypothetical protein
VGERLELRRVGEHLQARCSVGTQPVAQRTQEVVPGLGARLGAGLQAVEDLRDHPLRQSPQVDFPIRVDCRLTVPPRLLVRRLPAPPGGFPPQVVGLAVAGPCVLALPVADLDLALAEALAGLDGGVTQELLHRQLECVHPLAVVRLAQRHARCLPRALAFGHLAWLLAHAEHAPFGDLDEVLDALARLLPDGLASHAQRPAEPGAAHAAVHDAVRHAQHRVALRVEDHPQVPVPLHELEERGVQGIGDLPGAGVLHLHGGNQSEAHH